MIKRLFVISTDSIDPIHNLALEEYLLNNVQSEQCILYLWQNKHTVVIGRNQNAASECDYEALEADGGHLVRRLSGGGAVYHDLGNLNFTFLMPSADFDVDKQTEVILRAVQSIGIAAVRTGRNDLTVDDKKFSGHAYYHSGTKSYHHGTLMVNVDTAPLARYLQVSPLKLQAKGVKSVRSRVVNLAEYNNNISISSLKEALINAFSQVYNLPVCQLKEADLKQQELQQGCLKFASSSWRYGKQSKLEHSQEERFSWGLVRLDYQLKENKIADLQLWSDGLEADYLQQIPYMLKDCLLSKPELEKALQPASTEQQTIARDITALLLKEFKRGIL